MRNRIIRLALLLAATLLLTTIPAQAEVAYHGKNTLVAAITDGSDPFGSSVWDPLRPLPPAAFLNPDGASRGDGRPDIAWDDDGIPHVVWAYKKGNHHDIAFSQWDEDHWTPVVFLDRGGANALDPRVHVDDQGTVHVAWWIEDSHTVYTARRPAGTDSWLRPSLVAFPGKRPSLTTFDGTLRVVFETTDGDLGLEAIVVVRDSGPPEVFTILDGDGPLDPVIHSLSGKLWIDYKADDDEMGVLVPKPDSIEGDPGWLGAPWVEVEAEPWDDPSWIGVEFARRAVQLRIFTVPSEDEQRPE